MKDVTLLEGTLEVDNLDGFVEQIGEIGERHGTTIQAFDARYLVSRRHLERAVELADRAIARGENVARDRAVEILLYAAGRRQIDRALEMGVSAGENSTVILLTGGEEDAAFEDLQRELEFERTRTLADSNEGFLCAFFEITDAEREATDASLEDLVCERVALLEVEK